MHTTQITGGGEHRVPGPARCVCGILPPYILDKLAEAEDPKVAAAAQATLAVDADFRANRLESPSLAAPTAAVEFVLERTISDTDHTTALPGKTVRREGHDPVADGSANRAYDSLGLTFDFFKEAFGRHSIDDANLPLDATVHYRRNFNNAFWDGERMVFGDGDGRIFNAFTLSHDVPAHEIAHGFTQYTAGLVYEDQSGALNESISDVIGSLVKQFARRQTAEEADWLIGAGLFTPAIRGQALRSMRAPGTAFNDPLLGGKDPQPDNMAGFVEGPDDHGGVHTNSGIPNHAFYLVATAIGGFAWEKAGQIWYDTITSGELSENADFREFARATVAATKKRFGKGMEFEAVLKAWAHVGVNGNG
ncbi:MULTISPECIES: M4 family metallopeptidase [unclassified Streptomyces]|uniref:M4 family metallopeptidase n=1 Tax=unclassified Streptomyces TaxID=2593676 RepID=UPI001BEC4C36|nr:MULTISPECIES: M4 family metallopeptidase [unclassified Streptomyces]MBT2408790.1 M4 family metallopeptidase [Streptomyces sp. ISL-21]MBT2612436.1 M4 family metallopeptidase [Streptomyces sp. ISL-87]